MAWVTEVPPDTAAAAAAAAASEARAAQEKAAATRQPSAAANTTKTYVSAQSNLIRRGIPIEYDLANENHYT
jgi:hypothetical protein